MSSREYHKKYNKNYYILHKEQIKLATKKYREANKEKYYDYFHEYYLKNKELLKEYHKNYYVNNRKRILLEQKNKTVRKIENARDMGRRHNKIVPNKCECCKENKPLERHHQDYNKPKEVMFVCRSCHLYIHSGRIKNEERAIY